VHISAYQSLILFCLPKKVPPFGGIFTFLRAQKSNKKGHFPRPPRERIRVPFVDSGKDFKLKLLCVPRKTYNAVPNVTATFIFSYHDSHKENGYALARAYVDFFILFFQIHRRKAIP